MYVRVRVFLDRRQVFFVFVLIASFDNVAIGVIPRRIALEDVSLVACVFYSLFPPDS
jgi:hypothetical protein